MSVCVVASCALHVSVSGGYMGDDCVSPFHVMIASSLRKNEFGEGLFIYFFIQYVCVCSWKHHNVNIDKST